MWKNSSFLDHFPREPWAFHIYVSLTMLHPMAKGSSVCFQQVRKTLATAGYSVPGGQVEKAGPGIPWKLLFSKGTTRLSRILHKSFWSFGIGGNTWLFLVHSCQNGISGPFQDHHFLSFWQIRIAEQCLSETIWLVNNHGQQSWSVIMVNHRFWFVVTVVAHQTWIGDTIW